MDLTPNYVSESDPTFQEALKSEQADGDQFLSAFVTTNLDGLNNWKKIGTNESAWKKHGTRYFLSQFDNRYDLQMSSEVAQQKLKNTISILIDLGVKGFRLNNAKHFLISSNRSNDLHDSEKIGANAEDYNYFLHTYTTNQPGLGDIIRIFAQFVHNKTDGEGFLTIRDDAAERVENYVLKGSKVLGFDLPRAAFLNKLLSSTDKNKVPKLMQSGFDRLNSTINIETLWMQVPYNNSNSNLDSVAYNMFMSLLPGVKVGSLEELKAAEVDIENFKKLEKIRESPVFQFGTFDFLLSQENSTFAYIR